MAEYECGLHRQIIDQIYHVIGKKSPRKTGIEIWWRRPVPALVEYIAMHLVPDLMGEWLKHRTTEAVRMSQKEPRSAATQVSDSDGSSPPGSHLSDVGESRLAVGHVGTVGGLYERLNLSR